MTTDAARLNIAESGECSPLQRLLGYRLVEWEPDRAVVAYTSSPTISACTHRLHGIPATLLDTAAGLGCFSPWPASAARRSPVMTVNFVAAVRK
jgi:acyl-coenzyme A thioesterase PaaI-like protein